MERVRMFDIDISKLDQEDFDNIIIHYERAMETDHGSGDHWILMGLLSQYGFRASDPIEALQIAEEIIKAWYRKNR